MPTPLAAYASSTRLTQGPSLHPTQGVFAGGMHTHPSSISRSPNHRPSHRTDPTSDNHHGINDSSDSSHSQGGSPITAGGGGVEDPNGYVSSPYLRELLGLEGRSVRSIQGTEAAEVGSKLHLVCHHFETRYHAAHKYVVSEELLNGTN